MRTKNKHDAFSINSLLQGLDDCDISSIPEEIMTKNLVINPADTNAISPKMQRDREEESSKSSDGPSSSGVEKAKPSEIRESSDPKSYPDADAVLAYLESVSDGIIYDIKKKLTVIGCGIVADIKLQENQKVHTVSRTHAVIRFNRNKFTIQDNSSNGTFIGTIQNDEVTYIRIPKGETMEIVDGQLIRFADLAFAFHQK